MTMSALSTMLPLLAFMLASYSNKKTINLVSPCGKDSLITINFVQELKKSLFLAERYFKTFSLS